MGYLLEISRNLIKTKNLSVKDRIKFHLTFFCFLDCVGYL